MVKHILMAGVVFSVLGGAAQAASCAKRDKIVAQLSTKYSESLTAGGLQSSSTKTMMIEVWASDKTGTFTVIMTSPQGVSCVLASGTDWFDEVIVGQVEGTAG